MAFVLSVRRRPGPDGKYSRKVLCAISCVVATLVCTFLLLFCLDAAEVGAPREYFTVAILEHARKGNWMTYSPKQIVAMNLDYYKRATALAKSMGADIIVFPEYGIFPIRSKEELREYLESVPDPKGNWNPCVHRSHFSKSPMLQALSCMAMENDIVVLANTGDVQDCSPEQSPGCPEDGKFHYNANAVFDRSGAVISRYRKEHLYYEIGTDLPKKPQDPTFTTDFGRFASFIAFDMVYKHIVEVAKAVDGVFLSGTWADFMPFYNSIQYFQGWAIGNNATLILSNIQNRRSVGSGVFAGREGALAYTFNPDGLSKLLVSKVPKSKHTEPVRDPESTIIIMTDNGTEPYSEDDIDFENYLPEDCHEHGWATDIRENYTCVFDDTSNYTFVKLVDQEGLLDACDHGMCCRLDYSTLGMNESFYLGVINITHSAFDRYHRCEEKCLVVRCEDSEGKTCSVFPTKSSTVFLRLDLRANFTTPYVYPSVTTTGLRPAPLTDWNYDVQSQDGVYQSYLNYSSPDATVVVAALNGRCYHRDPPYVR